MSRFSDNEIRRYSRQMVLPEVGGVGQERLRAASATATSELEALYLAAAGVGTLVVPDAAAAEAVRALNPLVAVRVAPVAAPAPRDEGDDAGAAASDTERAALRAWRTLKGTLAL
jgi:molybdopterin/thiamine biosynthesis adenylyltransferase